MEMEGGSEVMALEEREILLRVQAGDKSAFKELYDQYISSALRVAIAATGNRNNAADAVQEAFIRIYNNMNSFDIDKPFKPWFYKILMNECKRLFHKNQSSIPYDSYFDNNADYSLEELHKFEEYEDLYKSIMELDEIYRISIVLKYLKGFSEKDIAEILEINVNTVKSRLFKGRQKLRYSLEEFKKGGDF